ncbi:HAD family hydrolase, partial [Streptomyces sp. NRRL S-455]|uniref:HAD family hydrolase n=1 Tax=Streptomyces sp. NRRL S-455 TaxID=1463908 RepID=UPI001F33F3C8
NSDTAHAVRLAENLKAPFEVVISAEEMGVYKPRLGAFDYMLDKLGVTPDELVHVSASPMYDLRSAAIMGIKNKVYMDRGWEHDEHWLGYERITDIADRTSCTTGRRAQASASRADCLSGTVSRWVRALSAGT